MSSIIGIDARSFVRGRPSSSGDTGGFISAFGLGVKVRDYVSFDEHYKAAIAKAFRKIGKNADYAYYCTNDIKDWESKNEFLNEFITNIAQHIERLHCFYSLFSSKRTPEAHVYGRKARKDKIRLSKPSMSYTELTRTHLVEVFPSVCAWRLKDFFGKNGVHFQIDYHSGHTFEAFEQLVEGSYNCVYYPGGDCVNPIISTADLLIELLDYRFEAANKQLLFENFRPLLPELGEKVLVYPIWNPHLRYIVPLESKPINVIDRVKHPVFWVFKQDSNVDSGLLKRSEGYRNLLDYAGSQGGIVKLFEKRKDADHLASGDFGVYFDSRGMETVETYNKIGIKLKPFKFDYMLSSNRRTAN